MNGMLVACLCDKVKRDVQKRKRRAIVTTTFRSQGMSYMNWNVLDCILSANHGGRQDWVCRGEASRDGQGGQETQARDQRINESGGDKPSLQSKEYFKFKEYKVSNSRIEGRNVPMS